MPNTNKVGLKRYDKTTKKWSEIRIQSSADITLTEKEISVQNNVGAYHPGATIPAGTTLSTIIENLRPIARPINIWRFEVTSSRLSLLKRRNILLTIFFKVYSRARVYKLSNSAKF